MHANVSKKQARLLLVCAVLHSGFVTRPLHPCHLSRLKLVFAAVITFCLMHPTHAHAATQPFECDDLAMLCVDAFRSAVV